MSRTTVLNLDALLAKIESDPIETRVIELFGRKWTLICDLNSFGLSRVMSGDPGAVTDFLINSLVEEERTDFAKAFSQAKNMNAERLGAILNAFVEAVGERPTTPPSGSGPGGLKSTSARKSAASSARVRAVRSTS